MPQRTCTVPECEKPARSSKAEWCKMHYHRWYRHGDVNRNARGAAVTASKGRRYRTTHAPDHPLAKPSGRIYVHQAVPYEAIGPGAHPCHWCGRAVRWDAAKAQADRLTVDHLNGVGDDNRRENLVPSCGWCNSTRSLQARSDALRRAGWWSHHDTVAKLGREQRVVRAGG